MKINIDDITSLKDNIKPSHTSNELNTDIKISKNNSNEYKKFRISAYLQMRKDAFPGNNLTLNKLLTKGMHVLWN